MVVVIEEKQIRKIIKIEQDALAIVEASFVWMAEGKVDMPPIMHMSVPAHNGDVDIKSAYVEGLDTLTVKLGSGFYNNSARGLPNSSSSMVVMSTETGFCEAVILENGYLTNVRTGMAGAVAAKYLARADVDAVGIIGAGAQARFQLECLALVRKFRTVYVYSRRQDQSEAYAVEMREKLGVEVVVCDCPEDAVRPCQILVTTTSSMAPIIQPEWLHPGLHITAMGSDLGGKQELDAACLKKADLLVCDRALQCLSMGELQYGAAAGINDLENQITELGELVSGQKTYQRRDEDITICDLTGMGVQDTAIASLAMDKYLALPCK